MKSAGKSSFLGAGRIRSAISPTGCIEGLESTTERNVYAPTKME